jgi:hypothetical protein
MGYFPSVLLFLVSDGEDFRTEVAMRNAQPIFARSALRVRDQSPHHIRPHCRQSEFHSLLLRKIENALTKLLKYAAVMCHASHRASFYHCPLIAEFATHWAQAQALDLTGFHHRSQIRL